MPFMDKGGTQAKQTFNTAANNTSMLQGNTSATQNGMMPQLLNNANKPQGFNQQQEAGMNTAAQQSVGGSNAGIAGEGMLTAGRTNNPGSMVNAIGMASRGNARNLANDALQMKEMNANMAQQKQQAALGELSKLYGTNVGGLNDMIKNQNTATQNITAAAQDKFNDIMKVGTTAASMGMMGAGMAGMGPGGGASAMQAGSGMMGG